MAAAIGDIVHKLWNRGIDIGVGVITSVIVAGVGLLFWRFKLWLDLRAEERKQRQQHRIAEEIEADRRRQVAQAERERLNVEMEMFAAQAEASVTAFHLADCWEHYFKWLLDNRLDRMRGNLKIAVERSTWSQGIRGMVNLGQAIGPAEAAHIRPAAQEAARIIRSTELPPEE